MNETQKLMKRARKYYTIKQLEKKMGANQCRLSLWSTGKSEPLYSRGKKLERIVDRKVASKRKERMK